MMNKITLLFAALMMTLGVSAQQTMTPEQIEAEGASKGYYTFEAEVIKNKMKRITTTDELKVAGKNIMIQHCHEGTDYQNEEGSFLTMQSLADQYGYHSIFMQEKPIGVGIFTTDGAEYFEVVEKKLNYETWQYETIVTAVGVKAKLQTSHARLTGTTCYVSQPTDNGYLRASKTETPDVYQFIQASDGKWQIKSTARNWTLYVQKNGTQSEIEVASSLTETQKKNSYFYIYEIVNPATDTYGEIKYVKEASVNLIGPAGNIVTTTHTGWSDFYEFIQYSGDRFNAVNYGISISNVLYHTNSNQITANIEYAFPVSGDVAKIPVHLCPSTNSDRRISIVDGNLKVVQKPAEGWTKDKNNQWYIYPKFEHNDFTYAIRNVETGEFLKYSTEPGVKDISLYEAPEDFTIETLDGNCFFTLGTYSKGLTFSYQAIHTNGYEYTFSLWGNGENVSSTTDYVSGKDFLVPAVSANELDGKPAIGFTRYFHEDTYFWDGGHVENANLPEGVKGIIDNPRHEGINAGEHKVYAAMTGIEVTQTGSVVVLFDYIEGKNALLVLGVDVTSLDGTKVVSWDYHFGKVGTPSEDNLYILRNVEAGKYLLRYWVCNRTDLDGWDGHNLKNVRGKIQVRGANYNLLKSEAPSADAFHANTTWFRMRLCDGLEKYISAQPAYTDWHNNLKLSNNTPPNDYAGLWTIVGDAENGYKFYNRAWGPEYAMKTVGENDKARTYMVPVVDASTYDIVQQEGNYQFFVKVHGEGDKFLNDRGGYLATWNNSAALGNSGSVMSFETVNMEGWETNTVVVENELKNLWSPWTHVNSDFSNAYNGNSTFASWVLGRQKLAELLNGKVFKFVNKGPDVDDRLGRVLRVDANNNMAGVVSQGGLVDDFLQIVDNGNGTFKLLHLATNKYFQSPSAHTITENAADAAAYSYKVYGDEKQVLCFVSGNEMMHLGNGGYGYTTINHNDIASGASRWDVIYDVDAQNLADLIARAKARYAETQETAYQANVGVPGYANVESTTELLNTFNGGLAGMTFAEATTALTDAMNGVTTAERTAVYPTDCYFTITNCGTTNDPRNLSVIYDASKAGTKDQNDGVSEFLWHNTSALDKNNPNHLWCFYHNEKNDQYYLYNVGKKQFASPTGKGDYGLTWIFSDTPVAITITDLKAETPTFHIKGGNETMSVSTGYEGSVITWYSNGDAGVPFKFEKSELEFKEINLEPKLAPGFYTLKCGNAYLSDDRFTGDTTRSMTEEGEGTPGIKNIFYNTEDNALVGFASGFGFVFATCNTGKPEDGYNTFEYGYGDETGTFTVKSQQGTATSPAEWNAGRYFKKDGGKLLFTTDLKEADSWTIEKVTELPVTLNYAGQGLGAYGTLWSPVALNIPAGIKAFYGSVSEDNALVLTEVEDGVIPAKAGVVLWDESATTTYVKNLEINADATVEAPEENKFVGWVFTQVNENKGYYYSLGKMNDHMAFYKYTGANLSGFRARIARQNAQGIQSLSFRFANPTSIEEVISGFQNNAVYDLNGRRVTTPEKGIYIVNGKKVIIK